MKKLNGQYENQEIYRKLGVISILSVVAFMVAVCLIVVDVAYWSMNGEFYMMNLYSIPAIVLVFVASIALMLVPKKSKKINVDTAQINELTENEIVVEDAQNDVASVETSIELHENEIKEVNQIVNETTSDDNTVAKKMIKKDVSFLGKVIFITLVPLFCMIILYVANFVLADIDNEILSLIVENCLFAMTFLAISYAFSLLTALMLIQVSSLMKKESVDVQAPKKPFLFAKINKIATTIKTSIDKKQQESRQNNVVNVYNKSVDVAGKSFIIKNYYKLKKGDIIDLIDLVELDDENSYDVIARIKAGKQIFNKELELLVLDDVVSTNDESIMPETKQLAIDIRKKEFDE